MKTTLFLVGPTDSGAESSTEIKLDGEGQLKGSAYWSSNMPIIPFVKGDPTLDANSIIGLVGVHEFNHRPNTVLNVFNLVADADAAAVTLQKVRALDANLHPSRYFNRPENVLKTARDKIPSTLADIPGCRIPRVQQVNPQSFEELKETCNTFSAWPLIIRALGFHGGKHMCLLENPSELESIKDNAWLYNGIFLIEFVDYKSTDGLYQKMRIMMVDGVPYARHAIISDQPFIHAKNRVDLMQTDLNLRRAEAEILADLRDVRLKDDKFSGVFKAIYQRIGLDVFGVDYAEVDGEILIFEANACMLFLEQDYGQDNLYFYLKPYIRSLRRAVKKLLMSS